MSAACPAILPLARRRLLEHADMLGASRDPHGARSPQREGVDGAANHHRHDRQWQKPMPSGSASTSIAPPRRSTHLDAPPFFYLTHFDLRERRIIDAPDLAAHCYPALRFCASTGSGMRMSAPVTRLTSVIEL